MSAQTTLPILRRGDAVFSPCERYRYSLTRYLEGRGTCVFVMLNPSTAGADTDDPTIRRCMGFARSWGFGRLEVVNLFAWRATNPKELVKVADPVGPLNDNAIRAGTFGASMVVLAWGKNGVLHGRGDLVRDMISGVFYNTAVFGFTKNGQPKHPLYLPEKAELIRLTPGT